MKKILIAVFCLCSFAATAQTCYSLPQLLDSAKQNNIALRTADYDIEAARQQRKEAFTKYFPNISATGLWFNANKGMAQASVTPSELVPEGLKNLVPTDVAQTIAGMLPQEVVKAFTDPISISMMKNGTIASIMALQPVFVGGQIVNGNKLARVGEDVSILKKRLSENEVEQTAEQYFWQLASLQEKQKTVAAVEVLLNDIFKDVNVAVEAGVAMKNDLLQVQLRKNDVASQKLKLQNGISILRLLLGQYCGLTDSAFVLTYDTSVASPLREKDDHQQALLGTAEYQLLEKQVEATRLQRKMTIGQNLPSVAVGAGYNYHNLLDSKRSFGMIFATINLPISQWWGGSHAMKRSKIALRKAEDQLNDNAQLLKIRMQNAWNGVEEAYQQLKLAEQSIEQAEENLRLNRNYYEAGISTMSDLLQAQLLYQQACDKRTDAFAEYHTKLMEYRHATGK